MRPSMLRHRSPRLPFEPLDRRLLLTSTAVLDQRHLTVIGDAAVDTIDIAFDLATDEIVVTLDGAGPQRFAREQVSALTVDAGGGNDIVSYSVPRFVHNTLRGGSGDDTISGSSRVNAIDGGDGDDSLLGGSGDDVIDGGAGNDTLIGDFGRDSLGGGDGNDTLEGGFDIDTLEGGAGTDTLRGRGASDFLDGGADSDLIDGGSSSPGEVGDGIFADGDFATYATRTADLTLTLDGVANDGEAGENDNLLFIETMIAGGGNDTLVGDIHDNLLDGGEGGHSSIFGQGGNDTLVSGDLADSLDGGSGDDLLYAKRGGDTLWGQGGNDSLFGDSGHDFIDGGPGNDYLFGGKQADVVLGQSGNDFIEAPDANFRGAVAALADGAPDTLSGGSGMDWLNYSSARGHFLSAGVSVTFDGLDNDGMAGENDSVASDFELIDTTEFNDFIDVNGLPARRHINAWIGNDTIIGSAGADTIYGDEGDDSITGNDGEDNLVGGAGNDTFFADDGFIDVVRGVDGNDSADTDAGDLVDEMETTS